MVVCFLVHFRASEAKNPGFDVAFRNQMYNRLFATARGEFTSSERVLGLLASLSHANSVGVDDHDQTGADAFRLCAIGCNGFPVTLPNPLLP